MYTAEELKQDVLVNVKGDPHFEVDLYNMLRDCVFQFNDSGEFTRIVWNTYRRNLVIFCPGECKLFLEDSKSELFKLCDKIHGEKDEFLLMSLEIIAKSDLSKSKLTDKTIKIKDNIIIDRSPENELGKGGFGKVYKYYDENTEEIYAYKIYDPSVFQISTPEIMKKRFIREGKKLLHYSHENVVKAFDFGFLGDESAYIKMEYINGMKLMDYLSCSQLDMSARENICKQYISAMAYVHSKSDMHRDISYSNVMVDKSDCIKVLDFGFARGKDDTGYDTVFKDIEHKFALPNEKYGIKTEVYCIGAILYSIITNEAFNKENLSHLEICDCNLKLKSIIFKCLNEEIDQRFDNAMDIKSLLLSENITTADCLGIQKFSLDYFREVMNESMELQFSKNYLPDFDTIHKWINEDLKEIIECHTFLSNIDIFSFINRLPYLDKIIKRRDNSYFFDKKMYIDMYNFYINSSEKEKNIFLKCILLIIGECSFEFEDLPFS